MKYDTICYDKSGSVATIILNRPEKLNAITTTMGEELLDCLMHCTRDPDIRALILTGKGKFFCAGGDILSVDDMADTRDLSVQKLLSSAIPVASELRKIPIPVIAAVNGPAVGGGFALALSCDLIIAAKNAKFSSQYVMLGINPDLGMTYLLPRIIGLKQATWLMFTGETVSPQKGYEMGFVNKVVEDSMLTDEVSKLARQLSESATLAIARTKELINLGLYESPETQMEHEKRVMSTLVLTDDCQEALRAFREKRTPKYKGL